MVIDANMYWLPESPQVHAQFHRNLLFSDDKGRIRTGLPCFVCHGRRRKPSAEEEGYRILDELSQALSDAICATAQFPSSVMSHILRFGQTSFYAEGQISYSKELPQPPVQRFNYVPTQGEDIPVWYIQLGDAVLLGVKPEVVTPVFLKIRSQSPFIHTLLATLVNGGQGYIAGDIDYDRYTYPGLKTPFYRGTDRVFIREVIQCLDNLIAAPEELC